MSSQEPLERMSNYYPGMERDDGWTQRLELAKKAAAAGADKALLQKLWDKYDALIRAERAKRGLPPLEETVVPPHRPKTIPALSEIFPPDMVVGPEHYKFGDIQTIDFIHRVASTMQDPFLAYCVGNVLKYVTRAGRKGAATSDYRKAQRYLEWAVEHLEKGTISHE